MAAREVRMSKIREVLRFSQVESSERAIESLAGVSRTAVHRILLKFNESGIPIPEVLAFSDQQLKKLIYPASTKAPDLRQTRFEEKLPSIITALGKKHETLEHQWVVYRSEECDGYGYSQFCHLINLRRKADPEVSAVIPHENGDLMYVDFAGDPVSFTGLDGITVNVKVFVAVLPASLNVYVGCSLHEQTGDWIHHCTEAIHFFGGAPRAIVPDCAKAVIREAHYYESERNPQFGQFADHYQSVIISARPHHPRDKAHAENSVNNVYRWIYPRLAAMNCRSFEELACALSALNVEFNERQMKKYGKSRREMFETYEKKTLKPLPAEKFIFKHYQAKRLIGSTSHVYLKEDRHYYSVPERFINRSCEIFYTVNLVEIHCENVRICTHQRDRSSEKYTTISEHLPTRLRYFINWTPQKAQQEIEHVGESAVKMVDVIFKNSPHPLQAMKSLFGFTNLARKYGAGRFEKACHRALNHGVVTARKVEEILLRRTEDNADEQISFDEILPMHSNIRYNTPQGDTNE